MSLVIFKALPHEPDNLLRLPGMNLIIFKALLCVPDHYDGLRQDVVFAKTRLYLLAVYKNAAFKNVSTTLDTRPEEEQEKTIRRIDVTPPTPMLSYFVLVDLCSVARTYLSYPLLARSR